MFKVELSFVYWN